MEALAENLSVETGCKFQIHDIRDLQTLEHAVRESTLLVNATSVGMAPRPDTCILPEDFAFPAALSVADIIYNPWETRLLSLAKKAGCKTFNGYGMLLYQGAEAFRIWTGQEMPMKQVREYLQTDF